ncbi:mitochondrial carrier domain-containing protein [Pyronema domesticum]|uniref:Similar to Carrier protein YMC1, mitochondrial acc. no. P32331 n=1 Tax=Pyronema omphalodes (strain CBS 100304) TaxID=1076935 RepID=U4LAU4_PYROM|nr:mitochondrial carrier domain-containing protein [Pyronema domesticum]CCX16538.1 Similar to Carrier protein YMC1, mitochondrial; acc. no. P32331 [Pyronema omphalodes CBS 100304]
MADDGLTRTLKDLFAGAVGGVAQVLIGQPFDIIKVRLQTTSNYSNALDAAKSIYKHEGPLAFYKGTLTPLLGIGACVSVQFGAFNYARRQLEKRNVSTGHSPTLSYSQYYLAGATAGIANTVLSAPIEHVRIRLQTQPHGAARLYNGPLDCIKKLVSAGALYRATNVTLLREAQAYGLWFTTFEFLMNQEKKREEVPSWKIALYGGLAGEALWLGSYPMDVVKSKMQTDGLKGEERKYKNAVDCARQVLKAEGVMGFWRGLAPTLMRAMPVSAGTFFVVETTMRLIK